MEGAMQNVTEIPLRDDNGEIVRENGKPVVCKEINGDATKAPIQGIDGKEFAETFVLREAVAHWLRKGRTETEARELAMVGMIRQAADRAKQDGFTHKPVFIYKVDPRTSAEVLGWYSGPREKLQKRVNTEGWKRLDEQALAHARIVPLLS